MYSFTGGIFLGREPPLLISLGCEARDRLAHSSTSSHASNITRARARRSRSVWREPDEADTFLEAARTCYRQ